MGWWRSYPSCLRNIKSTTGFIIPPHFLTNFEVQKYYQHEPKLNGAYSRNDLPKIKYGIHVINLDEYRSVGTHWIALYVNGNNETYFDSFWVEYILKET